MTRSLHTKIKSNRVLVTKIKKRSGPWRGSFGENAPVCPDEGAPGRWPQRGSSRALAVAGHGGGGAVQASVEVAARCRGLWRLRRGAGGRGRCAADLGLAMEVAA
jgi:hypothetical protein